MNLDGLHKSVLRSAMTSIALGIAALGALVIYTNLRILQYSDQIVSAESVPVHTDIIVFGGGMDDSGMQSLMQQDRVTMGVNLLLSGKGNTLIVSGDDGFNRFDEVSAMYDQAVASGAPDTAVVIDPHGYRTYESCWRARHVLGVDQAIVVSHEFHLPRIIYLCEHIGVEVIGVAADARTYDDSWVSGPRETMARVKAWWQAEVTKPPARVAY